MIILKNGLIPSTTVIEDQEWRVNAAHKIDGPETHPTPLPLPE